MSMVRLHPYPAVIIAQPRYERNKIFILLRSSGLNQRRGAGPGERIRAAAHKILVVVALGFLTLPRVFSVILTV